MTIYTVPQNTLGMYTDHYAYVETIDTINPTWKEAGKQRENAWLDEESLSYYVKPELTQQTLNQLFEYHYEHNEWPTYRQLAMYAGRGWDTIRNHADSLQFYGKIRIKNAGNGRIRMVPIDRHEIPTSRRTWANTIIYNYGAFLSGAGARPSWGQISEACHTLGIDYCLRTLQPIAIQRYEGEGNS